MYWNIYNRRFDSTDRLVDIEISPSNDALRYSIHQVYLFDYPEFIPTISNGISTGYEFVHFRFFNGIDWEDQSIAEYLVGRKIKEGEIFMRHDVMGATIIEELLFDKILYDYGCVLLEVYGNNKNIQQKYHNNLVDWIKYYEEIGLFDEQWKKKKSLNPIWSIAMQDGLEKLNDKIIMLQH